MKTIELNFKEKLILAFASLILIASSAFLLTFDELQKKNNDEKTPFGVVHSKFKNLKRKSVDAMIWEDLEGKDEIYLGDKLFTADDSNASLQIGPNSFIEMSPLTLIQLKQNSSKELEIELQDGTLKARIENDEIKTIQTKDAQINLSGEESEILVESHNNQGSVIVLSGLISLASGDKKQDIRNNEGARFSKSNITELTKIQFAPIFPSPNNPVPLSNSVEVPFEWKTITQKNHLKTIEISKDATFGSIVKKVDTDKSQVRMNLSDLMIGTYYWRINYENDTKSLNAQKFVIFNDSPPKLLAPSNGSDLSIQPSSKQEVEFSWENTSTKKYLFETNAINPKQDDKTLKKLTESNKTKIFLEHPGEFWWRVQAIFDNHHGPWSEKFFFKTKHFNKPTQPTYLTPENLSLISLNQDIIPFTWQAPKGSEYKLVIARDEAFKEIVHQKLISSLNYEWKYDQTGTFFWKVHPKDFPDHRKFWKFEIEKPEITLRTPRSNEIIEIDDLKKSIELRWSLTSSYQGEKTVILMKNGQEVERFKTKNDHITWVPQSFGEFSWKVESLDQTSHVNIFNLHQRSPLLAPKIKKEIRSRIRKKKSASFKLLDLSHMHLTLNSASSFEEGPAVINFAEINWDPISKASTYILEIYSDDRGKNLILSRSLRKNVFHWVNAPTGTYYFRVAFSDMIGRKSPFSQLGKLIVEDIKDTDRFIDLIYPKHKFVTAGEKFGFEWKPVDQAENYFLVIRDFSTKKIIKKLETKSGTTMTHLAPGIYRWQIIGTDVGAEVAFSEERFIKIQNSQDFKNSPARKKHDLFKNHIEADVLFGNITSKNEVTRSSSNYKSNERLNLFPSSYRIDAQLGLSDDRFINTTLNYKNGSSDDLNFLSDINFKGSLNWANKIKQNVGLYYGANMTYNSISIVSEDSAKNIGSSLNYLSLGAQVGFIQQLDQVKTWSHQLHLEIQGSFLTVQGLSFEANYQLRKNKISFLKTWKSLYENLYIHSGVIYHFKYATTQDDMLQLTSWEFPVGIGHYLD